MSTTKAPTEVETWMLLASVFTDNRHSWHPAVVERTGMPFSRFRALRRLDRGPLTGSQLAQQLGVDSPAASVILSDLVDRALATKGPDPSDGRRKIVSITEAGRAVLADVRSMPGPAPALAALSEAERRTLHRLLTKIQEASR